MPMPLLPTAITAHSKADEDKLSTALARLVAEDPTLRLQLDTETGQLVLWCMGEAHADVALDRLAARFGVTVDRIDLRVALRETFAAGASGTGRNVKQSGGHGQYAVCRIEVEPLPTGAGFEFVDKIVGGVVPRQFIPSVEKGVRAQLERGVRAGYPVVDVRVTLVDGKAHSVDSSDLAFQVAGGLALRDAAQAGAVCLLEPLLEVSILVEEAFVGAVMSDLATRRGRVVGTELCEDSEGEGLTRIRAEVPETELTRYASTVAVTQPRHGQLHAALPASRTGARGQGRSAGVYRLTRGRGPSADGGPRLDEQLTSVPEQAGQHPGVADHRHEVGVAAPARHDVLVQVGGNAGSGDGAEVDADVLNPWAPVASRSARIECWVYSENSAASSALRSA